MKINGVSIQAIITNMLDYVASDGSNLAKKYYRLDMDAYRTKQFFDVLLPLLYPTVNGAYELTLKPLNSSMTIKANVTRISAKARKAALVTSNPIYAKTNDERWEFKLINSQTGYFKFHTFATYNMDLDWKAFISNGFLELKKSNASNLIIDIRGNGGGMSEVVDFINAQLTEEAIEFSKFAEKTVYTKVLTRHRSYLGTWNKAVYDIQDWIKSTEGRFNLIKLASKYRVDPVQNSFQGKVYFLD